MTEKQRSTTDVFNALQQIIVSIEHITDVVHKVSPDEEIRKEIDTEIEKIAQRCVEISEAIGSTGTTR